MPYRSLIVTFEIIGGIVFVAFIAVLFAHMRLSKGPVSLKFLVKPVETAINQELSGSTIRIGNAVVQYDQNKSVKFRLQNVSLFDDKGDVVAQAPQAAIRLSGSALLKGRVAPAIVEFIEPRILLFYSKENGLSLSFPDSTTHDAKNATNDNISELPPGQLTASPRTNEVSLTHSVSKALDIARRRRTVSSYLTRFGLRNALVAFERDGHQSYWRVPYFEINMEHKKKRSTISGSGRIVSSKDDWGLKFRVVEFARKGRIEIDTQIDDLVPSKLHKNLPFSSAIGGITTPVKADLKLELSRNWDIRNAALRVDLSEGRFGVAGLKRPPKIKNANLNFYYRAEQNKFELRKSVIKWADSEATLTGLVKPLTQGDMRAWQINLDARDVTLDQSATPMVLDAWQFNGRYVPEAGYLDIGKFEIRAQDTAITLQGHVANGKPIPDVEMQGRVDPMPILRLKALWPAFLMPAAHDWFKAGVHGGNVKSGVVRISSSEGQRAMMKAAQNTPASKLTDAQKDWFTGALHFDLTGDKFEIEYLEDMPRLTTGVANLKIDGRTLLVHVPEGQIRLPSGRNLALNEGELRIADFEPDIPDGEITFSIGGDAQSVLELLDQKRLGYVSTVGFTTDAIAGSVKGNVRIAMPFSDDVKFEQIKIDARLNLEDGSLAQRFGGIRINGASIGFGVTEKALEASGDVLIDGVPAKLQWQRIFYAASNQQPPIRLTANLDDADRDQLGLEINHVVQGELPVVLTVGIDKNKKRRVSVQADLTNAELILENMAWKKPPGHTAILEFDIAAREQGRTELQNFKIIGDNIAIDGWLSLNNKNRLEAFYFPEFSVNLISHLRVEGKLNDKNIWQVKARGTTFDGRNLFQSLFSAGKITNKKIERPKDRAGIDLDAEISNLVGFEDTMLKNVKVKLSRRRGKLSALSARGLFNDGKPINVSMVNEPGKPRFLLSETDDAGSAFRLVGFYPSVIGGRGSLRINMDGEGYAEKIGKLWATNFYIRGDPVVGQVLVNTPDEAELPANGGQKKGGRKIKYSKTQFSRLKMSFSVGEGQLVLNNSYINGPLIGATIRGRIDYDRKRVDLGGTYVPLYGLNSIAGGIPLIGTLFRGRHGEGLFGITFLVQGKMANPNVIVNPISVITPGIFRQIFDMVPQVAKVRPRHRRPPPPPGDGGRSSGSATITALPPQRAGPPPHGARPPLIRHGRPPPPVPAPVRKPPMPAPESWAAETFAN